MQGTSHAYGLLFQQRHKLNSAPHVTVRFCQLSWRLKIAGLIDFMQQRLRHRAVSPPSASMRSWLNNAACFCGESRLHLVHQTIGLQ
jgi:hypothetical protein